MKKMKVYVIDLRFISRLFNVKKSNKKIKLIQLNKRNYGIFSKILLKNYVQTN